jgi:predicted Kef-type K+ transport protein
MGPYIRIALRYIAGYLVLKGVLPADLAEMIANDPEISAMIGLLIAGVVEGAYTLARRFGWAK